MAITGTQFWDRFLNLLGDSTSVRSYYLPNSGEGINGQFAQAGEYGNVIDVLFQRTVAGSTERQEAVNLLDEAGFWQASDDRSYWVAFDGNELDLATLKTAAEQRFPTMFDTNDLSEGANSLPAAARDDTPPPVGGTDLVSGVMGGGTLTKIIREGQDDLWGMTYVYAGIEHVYTFASFEDMERSLGAGAVSSGTYGYLELDESSVNDGDTWLLGDADIVAGQSSTYQAYFSDIMREAGLEAGSRNSGWAGRYANDPAVQRIIAMSQAGDWSDERELAELRLTPIYQELYPGIDAFLRSGSPDPESEWQAYMKQVTGGLSALGYALDGDGTYRSLMAEMLGGGISADKFNAFVPVFVRAEQSPEFAATLNKWTERDLGVSITFEDWFDILDGNTTPEIAQVVEKATLSFAAEATGTTLTDETISRLAGLTDLSEAQMRLAFNTAEEALLSVGQNDLARYGLTQQALVSAAFGIDSVGTDPLSSGTTPFTAAEIQKRARKAATELGIRDDRKGTFFVGFDKSGRPIRQGLTAMAPEAG